jgi:hypothetical protein
MERRRIAGYRVKPPVGRDLLRSTTRAALPLADWRAMVSTVTSGVGGWRREGCAGSWLWGRDACRAYGVCRRPQSTNWGGTASFTSSFPPIHGGRGTVPSTGRGTLSKWQETRSALQLRSITKTLALNCAYVNSPLV